VSSTAPRSVHEKTWLPLDGLALQSLIAIVADLEAFYFQIKIETLINAKKHTVSDRNILLY